MSASESEFATLTDHDVRRLAAQPGESEKEVLKRLKELNLHKGWIEVEGTDSESQPQKEKNISSTTASSTLQPIPMRASSGKISPVDPALTEMLRRAVKRSAGESKKSDEAMDTDKKDENESTLQPPENQVQENEEVATHDWEADFEEDEAEKDEFQDGPPPDRETINNSTLSTQQSSASSKKRATPDTTSALRRKNLLKPNDGDTTDAEAVQPNPPPSIALNASAKKRASSRPMSKSRKGGESAGHKDLNPKEATGDEVAWLGLHTKRAFLEQCERCFYIDPSSAEGFNSHLALYYDFSEDWSIPHPMQVRTCVMKRDSTQPLRWVCWLCHDPMGRDRSQRLGFKTSALQQEHWWKNHASQPSWDFCRQGHSLGVSVIELGQAILGVDFKQLPLPAGSALKMLPDSLPSHPKAHNAKVFNAPWWKRITPASHASEQGLPWRAAEEQALTVASPQPKPAPKPPAGPPPKMEVTGWGWPIFWDSMTLNNADISRILLYPSSGIGAYAGQPMRHCPPKRSQMLWWNVSNTRCSFFF